MSDPNPGVCLTFDDFFVDNWFAALPILKKHEARVTFCVSHLQRATQNQLKLLSDIQNAGHEIGYHTRTHPKLNQYIEDKGLESWIANEIDLGVREHKAAGFTATSFASPFHSFTKQSLELTCKRFEIVRAKGPRSAAKDLSARVYRNLGEKKAVHNIGSIDFQHPVQGGWHWLDKILNTIAETSGVGIFTGHDIRRKKIGQGFYCSHSQLDRFLNEVKSRELKFYTLTEFSRSV